MASATACPPSRDSALPSIHDLPTDVMVQRVLRYLAIPDLARARCAQLWQPAACRPQPRRYTSPLTIVPVPPRICVHVFDFCASLGCLFALYCIDSCAAKFVGSGATSGLRRCCGSTAAHAGCRTARCVCVENRSLWTQCSVGGCHSASLRRTSPVFPRAFSRTSFVSWRFRLTLKNIRLAQRIAYYECRALVARVKTGLS